MFQLDVLSDLSERIPYNVPDFPLYVGIGSIKYFHKYEAACHWHQDLEFCLILDGEMIYNVNGKTFEVQKGQGLFINSKRLHYHYCHNNKDCRYLVMTINPALFCTGFQTVNTFFENKFSTSGQDYIILTGCDVWHEELFQAIKKVHEELAKQNIDFFKAISLAALVSSITADKIQTVETNQKNDSERLTVLKMTGFIHKNYDSEISFNDVAAATNICRSKCYELFSKYIEQSPNTYLTNYRIQKSCVMLRNTYGSICEIALSCGFQNASYFTQVFRKVTGLTPKAYRERYRPL